MIRSMTGYGKARDIIAGRDITIEVKSVNHRYFEFSSKMPRSLGFLEEKLKAHIQRSISRGKLDIYVNIATLDGTNTDIYINHGLAGAYVNALRALGERLSLADDITLASLSRFSDIFTPVRNDEDEHVIWDAVRAVTDTALSRFIAMREAEGVRMEEDVLSRISAIESFVNDIEARSPQSVADYRGRLYGKLAEILGDTNIDEQRLLTEAAIFAEKTAVAEETVRLRSHIKQFRMIISSGEPAGRKLDFLLQEFNREINTIGSKAQDITIANTVVELKSEVEKVREQIQNIE